MAGYIGSHICVELLNSGYQVVVIDNLANSRETAFEKESIGAVIHLAGLNNITGT